MQAAAGAAGGRILKEELKIVVAEEPVESRPCLVVPMTISSNTKCLETGGYRAGGFNRLLIETRLLAVLVIEALRADRHKVVVDFAMLGFQQPIERFQTAGDHPIVGTCRNDDQNGLRQSRLTVCDDIFEPFPIRPGN